MSDIRSVAERNALVLQWSGIPQKVWADNRHNPLVAALGYEDAVGHGTVALVEAAANWNPAKTPSFCLSATVWVRRHVMRTARKFYGPVSVPYRVMRSERSKRAEVAAHAAALTDLSELAREESSGPDFYDLTEGLPPGQRELLFLRFVEGLTFAEIAERTGHNNRQAVWKKFDEVLKKLRKGLE